MPFLILRQSLAVKDPCIHIATRRIKFTELGRLLKSEELCFFIGFKTYLVVSKIKSRHKKSLIERKKLLNAEIQIDAIF